MNNVVVVGNDHFNTLWLIRSLGMGGFRVTVVIINPDSFGSFVCKSRYCEKSYIVKDFDEMIGRLGSLSFEHKVPIFANGDKVAIALDESYDFLSTKYILHHCRHQQGGIKYWMDKSNMLSCASKCGLNVPSTLSVDLNAGALDYDAIPYPCLIKPEISADASKNTFRVCYTEEQLKFAISEIKSDCAHVLIQEYVKRDYEYLVYGVSTEKEIILPGGLTKVHTCLDVNNLGMTSYAYLSNELPYPLRDFECIKRFVREMGYYGLFSIEFMITKDKAYFLEINLRNDGTCYITTQAGVNIPSLWAANVLGMDTSNMRRSLIRPRTYGLNEVNYLKYTVRSQSLLTSFKELFSAKAFSLCKYDDIMPVMSKIFIGFKKVLNKIEHKVASR